MAYVRFRPMYSEIDDQTKRPRRLKMLMKPTNPAPAPAFTRPWNISWIMGEACDRTPSPAVTLRQRTAHKSQNCGVRSARSAVTDAVVTSFLGAAEGV